MRVEPGAPHPLGATWDGRGTNFALFSANAERVELCLFDAHGRRELARVALPERSEEVWHGYLPDVMPGQLYGYRVYGPYAPEHGHRFNPHKLLIDPYTRKLSGRLIWSDAHFAYRTGSPRADLSFDRRDNARGMPKGVVVDESFAWGGDRHPQTPWQHTLIYEAHVKGLTMGRTDVPPHARGTFAGLAAPGVIAHLKRLGVTAIELLPVHAFVDDRRLVEMGLKNYWGYNTIGFFAPEPRYGGDNALDAFRSTVARLHDAGIEVLLDVVYNHTAEGNHLGPTLSFRGIDNASYYWLLSDQPRYYENFTGCGNALNLTHPRVLQMVMDSLRFWVETCHVDGFRFDLATTLARERNGFNPASAFFAAVRQDPILAKAKMIAEPWDIGLGGYQVGAFPAGWAEWNDVYRRTMRRYWRGDGGLIGEVSARMAGSADIFRHRNRDPYASINHVSVHDGFTLADLTSYEQKHNEANGEGNADGSDDNISTNQGVEGVTQDATILARRQQYRRNQLACLMLAQGVPLLLAGDEVGNSQDGNNNPYCQDNEVGWVDWSRTGQPGDDLTDFIARLTKMRRDFPQLAPNHWKTGRRRDGSYDVLWLTPRAKEMKAHDWSFPESRFLSYIVGPAEKGGKPLYVVLNGANEAIEVVMPSWPGFATWRAALTTTDPAGVPNLPDQAPGATLHAPAYSVCAFEGVQ